jgi:hypothetical protein
MTGHESWVFPDIRHVEGLDANTEITADVLFLVGLGFLRRADNKFI